MAYNNKPLRKLLAIDLLVKQVTARMAGVVGWFVGQLITYAVRVLVREGIYLIDIGETTIMTNMSEETWLKLNETVWAQKGLTPEQGKALDEKYIKIFDDFVVFSKVRDKGNN